MDWHTPGLADTETLFESISCTASFAHSGYVQQAGRRFRFCLFVQALFLYKWTQVCVILVFAGLQASDGSHFSSSMVRWFTLLQGPDQLSRTDSLSCFSINSNLAQTQRLNASTALSPPMSRWVPDTALGCCSLVKSVLNLWPSRPLFFNGPPLQLPQRSTRCNDPGCSESGCFVWSLI